jgi:hypothetical protein
MRFNGVPAGRDGFHGLMLEIQAADEESSKRDVAGEHGGDCGGGLTEFEVASDFAPDIEEQVGEGIHWQAHNMSRIVSDI